MNLSEKRRELRKLSDVTILQKKRLKQCEMC